MYHSCTIWPQLKRLCYWQYMVISSFVLYRIIIIITVGCLFTLMSDHYKYIDLWMCWLAIKETPYLVLKARHLDSNYYRIECLSINFLYMYVLIYNIIILYISIILILLCTSPSLHLFICFLNFIFLMKFL